MISNSEIGSSITLIRNNIKKLSRRRQRAAGKFLITREGPMKKIIILFLLSVSTVITGQWINNGPWVADINCISSNSKVYIASGKRLFEAAGLNNRFSQIALFPNNILSILNTDNGRLFVGTSGLKISIDGGKSFNDAFSNLTIYCLFEFEGKILCGTGDGLFISDNLGNTFTKAGLSGMNVYAIAFNSNEIFFGTDKGIFRSSDFRTYMKIGPTYLNYITSIIITEDKKIICSNGYRLFISSDLQNFSEINTSEFFRINCLQNYEGMMLAGGRHFDDYGKLITSTDGINWQINTTFPTPAEVLSFSARLDTLIVGTAGGIWYTTDLGATWQNCGEGIATGYVTTITKDSQFIYAATEKGDVFRSSDNGTSWSSTPAPIPIYCVYCLQVSGNVLFCGTSSGLFKTTNAGVSWEGIKGIEDGIFSITPNGNEIFAGGDREIYYSNNKFVSYSKISNPANISLLVDGNLLISGSLGFIRTSTDRGNTWTTTVPSAKPIMSVIKYGSNIYCASLGDGIFVSEDNGNTWKTLNNGLTNTRIFTLSVINTRLYAGSDGWNGSLFIFDQSLNKWFKILTPEFSNIAVTGIALYGERIFASTWGAGLWSAQFSEINIPTKIESNITIPVQFNLEQNYPNPFNPKTTINFHLPISGFVTLKIFDSLGREVTILINKIYPAGSHSVDFDSRNLSSGVYIYSLGYKNNTIFKKMLIIK